MTVLLAILAENGLLFFSYMVEDKSANGLSYVEFLRFCGGTLRNQGKRKQNLMRAVAGSAIYAGRFGKGFGKGKEKGVTLFF
ncbi:hypothetical protein CsSME_00054176 [Camellia sinensis var. sinensis]